MNDYVESEKQNLIDAIRGIINDKRDYADLRLLQEMCRGERYGVDKFGSIARVEKITNQTLFRYYQELLSTAHLELFYCGSAERERVEEAISRAFAPLQPRACCAAGHRGEEKRAGDAARDHRAHGCDAGKALDGLARVDERRACDDAGKFDFRRVQQFQALFECA